MANILLATPILSDAATMTAGDETAAGPVTNLQKMQITDLWESDTTTSFVEVDLTAVSAFNLVSLIHTNAAISDTWRVRTANSQAALTSAPTHDSGTLTINDKHATASVFYWISGGLNNQWVRVDISTAASPFRAGRLYIADALQPSVNYQYGVADGYDDDAQIDKTDGGNLIPTSGFNRSVLDFTVNISGETERHDIHEFNRLRGASTDVLIVTDPAVTNNKQDYLYYGLLQRRRQAVATIFNRHQIAYALTTF